jgi:hypothetical protein
MHRSRSLPPSSLLRTLPETAAVMATGTTPLLVLGVLYHVRPLPRPRPRPSTRPCSSHAQRTMSRVSKGQQFCHTAARCDLYDDPAPSHLPPHHPIVAFGRRASSSSIPHCWTLQRIQVRVAMAAHATRNRAAIEDKLGGRPGGGRQGMATSLPAFCI